MFFPLHPRVQSEMTSMSLQQNEEGNENPKVISNFCNSADEAEVEQIS